MIEEVETPREIVREMTQEEQSHLSNIERIQTNIPIDKTNPTVMKITQMIESHGGAIPYSTFMAESLFGEQGYYSAGKVEIGKDFTTSPEVSGLFGAAIANGVAKIWEAMGKPTGFRVVEMGAGKGTLAYAFLKEVSERFPEFQKAIKYTIVEYAKELIPQQKARINNVGHVDWIRGSAYEIPLRNVEGVFLSNELPDAFPIERVKRISGRLLQCYITIDETNMWVEEWKEPSQAVMDYLKKYRISIHEGIEEPINLNAEKFQMSIDHALKKGAIITIDYGRRGKVGAKGKGSPRVFGKDQTGNYIDKENFLEAYRNVGNVDITADINFRVLEQIARRDGLRVEFSGEQVDILRLFGLQGIWLQRHSEANSSKRSWRERISLIREIKNVETLHTLFSSGFYSQVLTKGFNSNQKLLSEPRIRFDANTYLTAADYMRVYNVKYNEARESINRRLFPSGFERYFISVQIGKKGMIVKEMVNSPYYENDMKYTYNADRSGIVKMDLDSLEGSIIRDNDGKVIYDLTTEQGVKEFVEKHGYEY